MGEDKLVGGRGKKAPYESITVRVPKPIRPEVDKLVEDYRRSVLNSETNQPKENE